MEKRCVRSVGLDKEEYEEKSTQVIEIIKRIRDVISDYEDSSEKEMLLLDLLIAIDSLIDNKDAFKVNVSLAISDGDSYVTMSYYEGSNLDRRVYDDVELLPTYFILGKDLKSFYFVREKKVLPNPEHIGRQIDFEVSAYNIVDDKVSLRTIDSSNFAYQVSDDCLNEPEELIAKLQKSLTSN